MAPDIGELLNNVVASLQKNVFICKHCSHQIEYYGSKYVPIFPCDSCGKVKWKIYSINDTVIYP